MAANNNREVIRLGKKQLMLLVSLMLALSIFLAACKGKEDTDKTKDTGTNKSHCFSRSFV